MDSMMLLLWMQKETGGTQMNMETCHICGTGSDGPR